MTLVTSYRSLVMGSWRTERRLAQVASRLRSLRAELAMVDEQLGRLIDDADELALRALVSETPAASFESNDARKHVDAMRRHHDHVVAEIAELEQRQDELLDRLTGYERASSSDTSPISPRSGEALTGDSELRGSRPFA